MDSVLLYWDDMLLIVGPYGDLEEFPHPLSRVKQSAGYRFSYQIGDSLIWLGIRDMINDVWKKMLNLRPITYFSGSQGSKIDIPHGYIWSPHLVTKPKGNRDIYTGVAEITSDFQDYRNLQEEHWAQQELRWAEQDQRWATQEQHNRNIHHLLSDIHRVLVLPTQSQQPSASQPQWPPYYPTDYPSQFPPYPPPGPQ
ncbi:unnamed protein product [Lactuca saligna]|uniref:Uncharacterized protein n=1 Tax=Lactuca saligna TaxID=75948 RepID=A0AA36EMZ6_LACSI|nr:unnamed protein product [Lactuca saligna]